MKSYIINSSASDQINQGKGVLAEEIPLERENLDVRSFTICLCILHGGKLNKVDQLPFIARYDLKQTYIYLTEVLGFRVQIIFRSIVSA